MSTPRKITKKPNNWKSVYESISDYRSSVTAEVDTMGCERLATSIDPVVRRFQTLTSLQLSSQTKDPVTANAIETLDKELPNGLCLDSVLAATNETINACIAKVGFNKKKTIYLKQTAELIKRDWNGDIPNTVQGI